MSDMPQPNIPPLPPGDEPASKSASDIPPLDPIEPQDTETPEGEPPSIPLDVPFIRPPGTQ
jgi:hypothetical protein